MDSSSYPTPPPVPESTDVEDPRSVRRVHISHEASIKSIGVLYWIGAVSLFGIGLIGFFNGKGRPFAEQITICVLLWAVAILQFWVGIGLRRLKPWAKTPTGILSGIGLIGFPVGTLINAYILYLVFSKKGTTVFSDRYKSIIVATPDIKYKTSPIVWVFVGLVLLVLGAILVASLFAHR